ncbi:hypothetical protein Trydic_g19228 [Trypoxylus dichotomus]
MSNGPLSHHFPLSKTGSSRRKTEPYDCYYERYLRSSFYNTFKSQNVNATAFTFLEIEELFRTVVPKTTDSALSDGEVSAERNNTKQGILIGCAFSRDVCGGGDAIRYIGEK